MVNRESTPTVARVPNEWAPLKLVALGLLTLFIALSIIIYLGSRLGGCMYLDGSRGPNDYNHGR